MKYYIDLTIILLIPSYGCWDVGLRTGAEVDQVEVEVVQCPLKGGGYERDWGVSRFIRRP